MNDLLTANEVAKIFNVTHVTLFNWRKSGKLRGFKQGYRRMYRREDVERLRVKQFQMNLEIIKRERTKKENEFFKHLDTKLSKKESWDLAYNIMAEKEYYEYIIEMAKKYKVPIPEWFKKECRQWNVST